MDPAHVAMQALIDETEALGWDFPDQLEVAAENPPVHEGFAIVGKLLTLKPLHPQLVRSTMAAAWNFAAPLSIEVLAANKFLFTVPLQSHVNRILLQAPWNIRGSLLLLQQWTPDLALEEINLHLCVFWVQVHGLPRQNMTSRNAIRIGKGLGTVLELDHSIFEGPICRPYLRIRVEINTRLALIPGFLLPRPR
jgi:hypothetical protein